MKLSKQSVERVKEAIRQGYNWKKELPEYWNEFVSNLAENVSPGVFLAVQTLLFKSLEEDKYFSPVKGVNIATNSTKDEYDPECFKGYLGFGNFKGEMLNTDVVFRHLEKINYNKILRIDLSKKIANKEIEIIKNGAFKKCSNTFNTFYFSRYMQYCIDKNTNGTCTRAQNFEDTIKELLKCLGEKINGDLNQIGAIEFILPEEIGNKMPEDIKTAEQVVIGQYLFEAIHS